MSAEDNVALARRIYELWNERDLEAALDMANDDVDIRLMALGQTLTGRDGFRRFMERFARASSDIRKYVTNQVASEDQVVMEFRLKGTHDGPPELPRVRSRPRGRRSIWR
ncbi:MAG: nuclear transport factor 2 family protein [Actinomycetota bacterium]